MADAPGPPADKPTTSTRDRAVLRDQLEAWVRRHHEQGAAAVVSPLDAPGASGMSSETLLFEVTWPGGSERLVARLSPDADAVPVFPRYDIEKQFKVMRLVREQSSVPVPTVRWFEPDPSYLGTPFLVMQRLDGVVPPDMLPYVIDSWVTKADASQRERLEQTTVAAIAELHRIALGPHTDFLHYPVAGDTPLRRHVADQREYYDWVVAASERSPLIERTFAWLDANWPDEQAPVISWGDSRIGNIIYDDFRPIAVLDWEMVGIAPREVDLSWLCFMHAFFQGIAEQYGLAGVPNFLQPDAVAAHYASLTGYRPVDLQWYLTYAALRFAIISFRIARRSAHFGNGVWPDDPDSTITFRATLEAMIGG